MPTQTFLKLNKEKKIRILKAAKKEFSRVSIDKAIIANIAKDAGIPRGSFYQYFSSVEDLYMYLIDYLYNSKKKKFEGFLQECNNDIYEALKLKFAMEIEKLVSEENSMFKVNAFILLFNKNEYSQEMTSYILNRQVQLDKTFFPEEIIKTKNFEKFLNLVIGLNDLCLKRYLTKEMSAEEIIKYYNEYIDFMKENIF